jgi:hypothetical protein
MLEKTVEEYLVKEVRKIGGVAPKWTSPGNNGVPDRIVFLPNKQYFIETKQLKGRLRKLQKWQIQRLRNLGADVRALYTKEEVDAFIDEVRP